MARSRSIPGVTGDLFDDLEDDVSLAVDLDLDLEFDPGLKPPADGMTGPDGALADDGFAAMDDMHRADMANRPRHRQ